MLKKYLKGSLLERLFLGAAVFPRVSDYKSMPRSERQGLFFDNAQMNVFAYDVKDHAFDITSEENHEDNPHFHSFLNHARACSEYFKQLRCTTRWNILAWLEFLTLYWLNEATYQHTPLEKRPVRNVFTGLNVLTAYVFNTAAKTLNLIGTPIVLVIMGVAVETLAVMAHNVGVGYGLFAFAGIALAMLCIGAYSAYIYLISNEEASQKAFEELVAPDEASRNIVLGIFTPLIRSFQNLKNFYTQHPYTAIASFVLGCTAILLFTLLPHLGVGAMLGFQLDGMILAPVIDILTAPETAPISMAVLSKTILAGICVGIIDSCVRSFKEVTGWLSYLSDKQDETLEPPVTPPIIIVTPPDLSELEHSGSPPLLFTGWDDDHSAIHIPALPKPDALRRRFYGYTHRT